MEMRDFETKWADVEAIADVKCLKLALKEAKNEIALKKFQKVDVWTETIKAIKEAKMVIEKIRYSTFGVITQLRNELYTSRVMINLLEYSVR